MKGRMRLLQIVSLVVISILMAACSTSQAEPAPNTVPGVGGDTVAPTASPAVANPSTGATGSRLQSTKWTLVAFGAGSTAQVVDGSRSTLEFGNDGKVSGKAGCNGYGGMYTESGNSLTFREIISTMMACSDPQGIMDQEKAFLDALNGTKAYNIDGNQLHLLDASGKEIMVLQRGQS
ncbi:MAG: META domain-containing protein [Chloroflexi bacterium]|nr:META domain-containing protein [Chloroflexota bacterium]